MSGYMPEPAGYAGMLDPALDRRPAVVVEFFSNPEENADKTRQAGHAVFDDIDYARWWKRGSNQAATECRVDRMKKFYPHIWEFAAARYKAWKEGQEMPLEGTPLAQWPMVSRGQVETLRTINLRTVEELAATTDGDFARIGPGARDLREKARAWLKVAADTGKIAAELKSRDDQIASLQALAKQQAEDMQELRAALDLIRPRKRTADA